MRARVSWSNKDTLIYQMVGLGIGDDDSRRRRSEEFSPVGSLEVVCLYKMLFLYVKSFVKLNYAV